jgi:hypothetical protein
VQSAQVDNVYVLPDMDVGYKLCEEQVCMLDLSVGTSLPFWFKQ